MICDDFVDGIGGQYQSRNLPKSEQFLYGMKAPHLQTFIDWSFVGIVEYLQHLLNCLSHAGIVFELDRQ